MASIKYLGVTVTHDLRCNTHISNMCTKANRTLGFLRRNLYQYPQDVKEAAYKGLVRPALEYGSSIWDPQNVVFQEEIIIKKVQNRVVRFVSSSYCFELEYWKQSRWESRKKGGETVDIHYTKTFRVLPAFQQMVLIHS